MARLSFEAVKEFDLGNGRSGKLYSLPELERQGLGAVSRLPVSLRIVLESVLRNCDGKRITDKDVRALAGWRPQAERKEEIPFVVARILLQDFTGVPLVVDLAAMRSAAARAASDPGLIRPLVPLDLVIDHSVQVDYTREPDALEKNSEMEFKRNNARYRFLKWGETAFEGFRVVPPEIGICHQVNLEYLARGLFEKDGVYYPDTLVGTDSHTTMINGLGVVGWGVGGIEAEAGMLGQPLYFLTPDVLGVHLHGSLRSGVTATDLVLHLTQLLRRQKVVGKFVEYFGDGAASLSVADRATIANMSPEYGATMGFFPIDENSCRYLEMTGRPKELVERYRRYFKAQGLFGMPKGGEIDYSAVLDVNLADVKPSVSGPARPQDRIALEELGQRFATLLGAPKKEGGYGKQGDELKRRVKLQNGTRYTYGGGNQDPDTVPRAETPFTTGKNTNPETEVEMMQNRPTPDAVIPSALEARCGDGKELGHGDVVIAAITSCTNTSNPSVMMAAGLLAKKAVEHGLRVPDTVKTSLAPGSRVVTDYLAQSGLQKYLDKLGFYTVGYGCTTCIGNSGPLAPAIEAAILDSDLIVASVLSGNRNFEARIHQSVKANFLMSPPLVVAFALAGTVKTDLGKDPLGKGSDGKPVYLKDIWPSPEELEKALGSALDPEAYRRLYQGVSKASPKWNELDAPKGVAYQWDPESTYVREPPYFEGFEMTPPPLSPICGARALAVFGDSVTTDHISPAGAIPASSPAGRYLIERGVAKEDFNTYGARRGNHEVMVRGTFANVRIKNLLVPGVEGGWTVHQPSGDRLTIYDAATRYLKEGTDLLVFAGAEYGSGSSRDWAAKGTRLLGVRAVIAKSFERIHRSNLIGMGVLPCELDEGTSPESLHLDGTEQFDLPGLEEGVAPRKRMRLLIRRASGARDEVPITLRIDTETEAEYYRNSGILPYVLRQILKGGAT